MNGDAQPSLADRSLRDFLDATAAKSPVPGGGAIAAATLATAAALGRMVLAYTLGKARFAGHAATHADAERSLAEAQAAFLDLADADAHGYARLNTLQKLNPDDPARGELPAAVEGAIEPPLRMAERGDELVALLSSLDGTTNPHLASDLAIALDLACCGRRAAMHNVVANLSLLEGHAARHAIETRAGRLRDAR